MNPPLRLVLFDMDDVLCRYDRPTRIAHLARLSGRSAGEVEAKIWDSGFELSADRGQIGGQDYLNATGARLGCRLGLEDWIAARRASMTAFPEMFDLVAQLRRRHRVAVLTNNVDLVAQHADTLLPGIVAAFGADIYASGALRLSKPDPAVFHAMAARLGVTPEESFFVDDLPENVAGARAAGMAAHRFDGIAGLLPALTARGAILGG